ncbi:hypothetical protein [Streptomyces sp. NPDC002990]
MGDILHVLHGRDTVESAAAYDRLGWPVAIGHRQRTGSGCTCQAPRCQETSSIPRTSPDRAAACDGTLFDLRRAIERRLGRLGAPLGLALLEQRGGQTDAVHDADALEPRLTQRDRVLEVDPRGPVATAESGEVARGDRAGAGVFGRVLVAHPRRDAIAGPARQEFVAMIGAPAEFRLAAAVCPQTVSAWARGGG